MAKRFAVQWPKDSKGAIRRRKSKKDRQYNGQKIAKEQSEGVNRRFTTMQWPKDCKGAIRRRKSKKDRQYNGQKTAKGQSEGVNQKGQSEGVNRRKTDNTMAKR